MAFSAPEWINYQKRTSQGKPRSLLIESLSYIAKKENALDLGAGALTEAQFLLDSGFQEVIAIDITPQFKELVLPANARFIYLQEKVEEYTFPQNYFDLISAQLTLPFMQSDKFKEVWAKIRTALKTKAIFTGQLFGERDDWSADSEMTFHSKKEVYDLLQTFEIIKCVEKEYTEKDARKKHWHYFELIIRKL